LVGFGDYVTSASKRTLLAGSRNRADACWR
jgi:hypothetical protein